MKLKLSIKALFTNILLALILFVAMIPLVSLEPAAIVAGTIFTLGCIPKGSVAKYSLMAGLQKEIWISQFIENFYPTNDFITDGVDYTQYVENNKINFASAGPDPNVVVNRTRAQRPIPISYSDDNALSVELDDFSSDTTVIVDAESIELAYPKMEVELNKHRRAIRLKYANTGLYSIAPDTETDHTLILEATGADTLTGEACYTDDDFSNLASEWDEREYPQAGRVVVMSAWELRKFSRNSTILKTQMGYKLAVGTIDGVVGIVHGFEIKTRTTNALYMDVAGTYVKQAFGKVETINDFRAAVAYIKKESFAYADGETKMYDELSVDYQGHKVNFTHRGLIKPLQQKVLAALIIPKS